MFLMQHVQENDKTTMKIQVKKKQTRVRGRHLKLLIIHATIPAHTHVDDVRLPSSVVTVQLQHTHAALAPAHAFNELGFRKRCGCNAVDPQNKIAYDTSHR